METEAPRSSLPLCVFCLFYEGGLRGHQKEGGWQKGGGKKGPGSGGRQIPLSKPLFLCIRSPFPLTTNCNLNPLYKAADGAQVRRFEFDIFSRIFGIFKKKF